MWCRRKRRTRCWYFQSCLPIWVRAKPGKRRSKALGTTSQQMRCCTAPAKLKLCKLESHIRKCLEWRSWEKQALLNQLSLHVWKQLNTCPLFSGLNWWRSWVPVCLNLLDVTQTGTFPLVLCKNRCNRGGVFLGRVVWFRLFVFQVAGLHMHWQQPSQRVAFKQSCVLLSL